MIVTPFLLPQHCPVEAREVRFDGGDIGKGGNPIVLCSRDGKRVAHRREDGRLACPDCGAWEYIK